MKKDYSLLIAAVAGIGAFLLIKKAKAITPPPANNNSATPPPAKQPAGASPAILQSAALATYPFIAGMQNQAIYNLQIALNNVQQNLVVDGIWGAKTQAALQSALGVDNIENADDYATDMDLLSNMALGTNFSNLYNSQYTPPGALIPADQANITNDISGYGYAF